jgi:CHAT domain-containing protein
MAKNQSLFIVFLLTFCGFIKAQTITIYEAKEEIKLACLKIDSSHDEKIIHQNCLNVIKIAEQFNLKDAEIIGIIELELLFDNTSKPDSLSFWLSRGMKIFEENQHDIRPTLYDSLLFRQHYHTGRFYYLTGNYHQAKEEFDWLWYKWKSKKNHAPLESFYTDLAMRWIAEIATSQEKYSEVVEFSWRSLRMYEISSSKSIPDQRVMIYAKLVEGLILNGELELAEKLWINTLEIINKNKASEEKYPYCKIWALYAYYTKAKANLQIASISPDSSLILLKNALIYQDAKTPPYLLGDLNFQYGKLYAKKKEHLKAIDFYEKSTVFYKIDSLYTYDNQADCIHQIAKELVYIDKDRALFTIQKNLNSLGKNFTSIDPKINPDPNRIDLKKYLSEAIALKTAIFLQKAKENPQDPTLLETAMQCGKYQMDLLETMRSGYAMEADKMTLITNAYHALENVWETYRYQYEKTKNPEILQNLYAEQTKAKGRVMLERLSDASSLRSAGLNSDEINTLFLFKSKAASLEKTIFQTKNDDTKLATLHLDFTLASQKHQEFRKQLEQTHPRLQQQNAEANSVNVAQVQQHILDEKTAMIEYFVGDSAIFAFVFTKNTYNVHRIARPDDMDNNILILLKTITNAQTFGRSAYTNFSRWSDYFYRLLLAPTLKDLPTTITRLIIIPDGQLSNLPFEVLGQNDPIITSFKKYPYLLKQYAVSYALSTQVLLRQLAAEKEENNENKAFFAGFAPKYPESTLTRMNEESGKGYDLPGAANEVSEIATLLNGNSYLGNDASVEQFKQQANRFKVLLLAMHAIPDMRQPNLSKLLFTHQPNTDAIEADLTTIDILQMDLSADLVVLSACQTGLGKLRKGEGILSITRGFVAAGAKSVVMSLWKVPDATTHPLMVSFFKALKTGMRKDEALRQAKLEFLDNDAFVSKQNPCFWAGFVVTGTTTAVIFF